MTAELNGGCLDEREAFEAHYAKIWKERTFKNESIEELTAVLVTMREGDEYNNGQGQKPAFINNLWQGWKAGRAALSASKQDGWQPISTAPKDGTHILVSWPMRLMDDEGAPTGEITRRDTLVTWMNGNAWIEPDYLGASGEWYGDDDCYAADPDFWMPLPPAPAAQHQGDKSHE
jgi:hypothetical protein